MPWELSSKSRQQSAYAATECIFLRRTTRTGPLAYASSVLTADPTPPSVAVAPKRATTFPGGSAGRTYEVPLPVEARNEPRLAVPSCHGRRP